MLACLPCAPPHTKSELYGASQAERQGGSVVVDDEEIASLNSGALAELSFFFKIPAPNTFRASVANEVSLFQLTRDAYQKATMMYPHEAERRPRPHSP